MTLTRRSLITALAAAPLLAPRAFGGALFADAAFRGGIDASQHGILPGDLSGKARAFNRLLAEASASGQPVFLPPGTYELSDIELPETIRIEGVPGATRLLYSGEGSFIRSVGARRVALVGLTLDGANRWLREDRQGLVTVQQASRFEMEDCEVLGAGRYGLWIERSSGRVDRNIIRGAAESGVYAVECSNFAIRDNEVSDCGNGGILVHRWVKGDDGTIVTGNRISRILAKAGGTGEFGNGINVYQAGNVQVASNVIADCAFTAIRSNAGDNVQITGNHCRNSGETAIYSEFGFEGALIANNLVDGAACGILSVNFNEGGRMASITGNVIRNLKLTAPYEQEDAFFGIGIEAEADAVVSANVIENAPRWGMLIGWGPYLRNVNVTGNVIRKASIGIATTVVEGAGPATIRANQFAECETAAIAGFRWKDQVTGDLAVDGASGFPHLDIAENRVS